MHKLKQYKTGLNFIHVPIKGIETVTVMALFKVGSKQEQRDNRGVSHFLEHMMFKGTDKRPDIMEVSRVLDEVGGEYNAFTAKEYTGYYTKVGNKHFDLALDWLSDMVVNAKLRKEDMEKERQVIIEEMNMYEDTPMQHIGDLFENLVYGDQPAGWDIIGTKKTIKAMTQKQLLDYKKNHYVQENCVVCVAGNVKNLTQKKLEAKIAQYFAALPQGRAKKSTKTKDKQAKPAFQANFKKTDQTHCIIGFRTVDLFSDKRYVLALISTILGGGMSSRLFMEVREKHGLAYSVHADSQIYTDSGYFSVQAGLETANFEKALKVILAEFKKIKTEPVNEKELKKAKEYIRGQIQISFESSNSRAMFFSSQQLLKGKIETLETRLKKLDKISAQDILKISKELFTSKNLNVSLIGPKRENKQIREIIKSYV